MEGGIYSSVQNIVQLDEMGTIFNCSVVHKDFGLIEFTASKTDPESVEVLALIESSSSAIEPYVVPPPLSQAEVDAPRVLEIKSRLTQVDIESIRPLRAIATNTAVQFDVDKLNALDAERATLIAELVTLDG